MKAWGLLVLGLLCSAPALAQDAESVAGMEAATRGDWAAACVALRKSGDARAGTRRRAAQAHAIKQLGAAIPPLVRAKRWSELAEVAACGMEVNPKFARFGSAAKRAAKQGVELPAVDTRIRQWARYGKDYVEASALEKAGVDFLVKNQKEDGSWDADKHKGRKLFDPGVTGLALLAVLPHRKDVAERAAKALLAMQHERGHFGSFATHSWIYNHVLATEALAEYAIATRNIDAYRKTLERAVTVIVDAQNPGAGWRYEPRGGENDTCVTVRAVSALDAARRAGLEVDGKAFADAQTWVASMTDKNFGQIGYNFPGGAPARPEGKQERFPPEHSQAMTAAGCVVYALTGRPPFEITKSMALLDVQPPQIKYADMYYWELAARAYVNAYGGIPAYWYRKLIESVAASRGAEGAIAARGVWGGDGGAIYSTAVCLLALSAPYRERTVAAMGPRSFLKTKKRMVVMPGYARAVPTGIYVDSGTALIVRARGVVVPYGDGPQIGPRGTRKPVPRTRARTGKAPTMALMGCVDDAKPFPLPPDKKVTTRASGHLWLLLNDQNYHDNLGWFDVTIELVRQ